MILSADILVSSNDLQPAEWQDQVHHRECHEDAGGAGRHQDSHSWLLSGQLAAVHVVPLCFHPLLTLRGIRLPMVFLLRAQSCFHTRNAQPDWVQSIRVARDAICSLILGSPPGKVYSKLRSVCTRLNEGM